MVFCVDAGATPTLADKPTSKSPAFHFVRDGKPAATIVLPNEEHATQQLAAEELQRAVQVMSGATLPIARVSDAPDGARVYIGESAPVSAMNLDIPTGFSRDLDTEGFVVYVDENVVVLAGNDGGPVTSSGGNNSMNLPNAYRGSLFAVYELLNRLGCRWYYPGEFGEVIPKSTNVNLPKMNQTHKPSYPVRGYWFAATVTQRKDDAFMRDIDMFRLRCRFLPYGSVLASAGDGSIMKPFTRNRYEKVDGKRIRINEVFEQRPELFAEKPDGSRNSHYLCLSHPDVLDMAVQYALDFFEKNPNANCFGYAPPDGAPTCACADCRSHNYGFMQKPPADPEIQDISDGFYWFLNKVAERVAEKQPDKWITTTAYSGRVRPPEGTKLHPNISLHTALLGHSRHHRYDFPSWQTQERMTLYRRWGKVSDFVVERPYFPPLQFHAQLPLPMGRALAYNVRILKDLNLRGCEWEGRSAFFAIGVNYYVRGMLLWNRDSDVDALLDDHYQRFYGPAAKPVQNFFDQLEVLLTTAPVDHHEEERIREIYPHEQIVKLTDSVGDLESLAKDADAMMRKRVRFAQLAVDHLRAYSDMRHAESQLQFAKAADLARKMIAMEEEVEQFHSSMIGQRLVRRDNNPFYGDLGANATAHGKLKQYVAKQKMIDGSEGDLVAALPVTWQFTTDAHDEGLTAQWYLPGDDHGQTWRDMKTTASYEIQGLQDEKLHGYNGFSWYRVSFEVPEKFKGRKIMLFLGGVNDESWTWNNGHIVGHQPFHQYWMRWKYHHTLDMTDSVKFGETNHLAVRIRDQQNFGGIFRRCFIYAPKE